MDRRILYLTATVAVIAALTVGVGYAYALYFESTDNEAVPAYVTITQTGEGYSFTAEDATISLDKLVRNDGTYYGIGGGRMLNNGVMGSFYCADLGSIGFHADLVGGDDYPDLGIEVRSSTNFTGTANWIYFLTDGSTKIYAYKDSGGSGPWKKGPDTLVLTSTGEGSSKAYADASAHVYYGYSTNNSFSVDGVSYLRASESPRPLQDATIVFRASDPVNHAVSYIANNSSSGVQFYIDTDGATDGGYLPKEFSATGFTAPEGRTFLGWSRTVDGDILSGSLTVEGDITLYAKYGQTD